MLKQLVSRENGSSDVDLSVRVQHALVEVDVCVAPEPLRLHEGSSRVCRMMVACPVVSTVAAGRDLRPFQSVYSRTSFLRIIDYLASAACCKVVRLTLKISTV